MAAKNMLLLLMGAVMALGKPEVQAADYYTEPQVYHSRPLPTREYDLGPIGVTGIEARIYPGVAVTVERTQPNTPAHGKFDKGDIIVGVNGVPLQGKNPLVALGTALTEAEATDGVMTFDVTKGKEGQLRKVTLKIPVLGSYSKTFPLNCTKSKKIIEQAARFYSGRDRLKEHSFLDALACLFLLSTGEDAYVPRVKEYFSQFLAPDGSVKGVGDNTWHGYNGVACAEYYLRTGDPSVLPLLQYYCDDARDRQSYGIGWGHWGKSVNPAYEAGGGLMHCAGNQELLTLVLGKMCEVHVDDKTLLGALRHWYRFVGHGALPLSDQRCFHIFRSAGRDGATACVMQVASRAKGDVTIYRKAEEYLAMSALTSWPERAYSWEVYWHSLAGHFMLAHDPDLYYTTMQRFRWRYDLSRQASGAFYGHVDHPSLKADALGISLALAYTAPLKTLCITGAPRSRYAKDFTLPERLWGTEADLAFLTSKHHKDFTRYGEEEEIHIPYRQLPLGLRYSPGQVKDLSLNMMLKNVRHARYTIRMAAAKALCMNKRYAELEALLRDPDPRLRRAALDGINDNRPWFTELVVGQYALKADKFTPAMAEAITKMLNDPEEAWFVVDGALNALSHAPVELVEANIPNILKWKSHEDWWLRESAFNALMGLRDDEQLFTKQLPVVIDMMIREYRYNPRHKMVMQLQAVLRKVGSGSALGKMLVEGFTRAARESTVLPDVNGHPRSREGTTNIVEVALLTCKSAPEAAAVLAAALAETGRLQTMDTDSLMKLVKASDGHIHDRFVGLYPALNVVNPKQKQQLTDLLYDVFRPELIKRLASVGEQNEAELIDRIIELTRLKKPIAGWQSIGTPKPTERACRFHSFDPLRDEDKVHPRVFERFRTAKLPAGMDGWYRPEFDDSQWKSGTAPVGVGEFKAHGHGRMWTATPDYFFENHSNWGEGEFLLMRTAFDVADTDCDYYRVRILTARGYTIYLNGKMIKSYPWTAHYPQYVKVMLTNSVRKHLKKGRNALAVYGMVGYEKDKQTGEYHPIGQMDIWIEGLRKDELGLTK